MAAPVEQCPGEVPTRRSFARARPPTAFDALVTRQWGALSEREFTRRTGITSETTGRWRSGRSVPKFHTVARLALLLGVSTVEVADAIADTIQHARQAAIP